ncbi:hypothetical protein V491_06306, partial [Pseudogymnoascus sp. VKM F-3775]
KRGEESVGAEPVREFLFARACEYARHEEEDVERGDDVEDLEDEVPVVLARSLEEEVDVAGAKDEGVEAL